MIKINKLSFLLLLFFALAVCSAQDGTSVSGRVISGKASVKGVFVINKKTGAEVKTDTNGNFSLIANPGDVLVVHSSKVAERQFVLSEASFSESPYVMEVNCLSYELEELVIDKNNKLDAESLGLVPKGQKQYTQQQKKLYTATGNKPLWMLPIGLLTGSMPLNPFINAVTGRTKKIKSDVANEKVRITFEKINGIYTEEELINQLKIPEDYTQGFLFYAAEDTAIAAALETKTTDEIKFMLVATALKYNTIITAE